MSGATIAVFDTNVVVSGFLNPYGGPGRIVEWLRSGVIRAGLEDRIAAEYEEDLRRPELHLPRHEVMVVLRQIVSLGAWATVEPQHVAQGLPDPDDAPFVECARALACDLVTGNKRHFPRGATRGVAVLSPTQFCEAVTQGPER